MNFLLETFRLGLSNLLLHKLRSLLTALGIIFGVGAVIVMVAIGEGNKQRALADIRELGDRNIIVRSVRPASSKSESTDRQSVLTYGIKRTDVERIAASVRPIERVVVLKQVGGDVTNGLRATPSSVYGTQPELLHVTHLAVERGRYLSDVDMERRENVAVVGAEVAARLFPLQDPLACTLRIGAQTFHVVGVLRPVGLAGGAGTALVGRDLNFDIHIPLTTAQSRFGDMIVRAQSGSFDIAQVEVSEVYIQAKEESQVVDVADQVKLVMEQSHPSAGDFSVTVPLELLAQAERTLTMFNALMAAIASISLLIGGIGIMNIMLASVTERTREIGIRRALGATRIHVIAQFLVETTVLSGLGGVLGIVLGLASVALLTVLHSYLPAIETPRITLWSVTVSFFVAAGVGVVFGLYPAVQAARQDPIVALRHD